jgi:mono/diheme cytochrome c family protein
MHHIYTRRLVVAMVSFFAVAILVFGLAVSDLRALLVAAFNAGGAQTTGPVTLPDGEAAFANLCASCHQAQSLADDVATSLEPDATSLGQLEQLVGPPPHGGASPAEALAIVVYLRSLAGLGSEYEPGVPTPPAAATTAAALPTPTEVPLEDVAPSEFEAVFEANCRSCHRPGAMSRGLSAVEDPDLASQQAIEFIAGSRKHRDVPPEAIVPAFNYIRQEAGLPPLPDDALPVSEGS